jgi:hypothetical protein
MASGGAHNAGRLRGGPPRRSLALGNEATLRKDEACGEGAGRLREQPFGEGCVSLRWPSLRLVSLAPNRLLPGRRVRSERVFRDDALGHVPAEHNPAPVSLLGFEDRSIWV